MAKKKAKKKTKEIQYPEHVYVERRGWGHTPHELTACCDAGEVSDECARYTLEATGRVETKDVFIPDKQPAKGGKKK